MTSKENCSSSSLMARLLTVADWEYTCPKRRENSASGYWGYSGESGTLELNSQDARAVSFARGPGHSRRSLCLPRTQPRQVLQASLSVQAKRKGDKDASARENVAHRIEPATELGRCRADSGSLPAEVAEVLESCARESEIGRFGTQSFEVSFPAEGMKGNMARFAEPRKGRAIHMLAGARDLPPGTPGRVVALVATVQEGQLIHLRRLHSR